MTKYYSITELEMRQIQNDCKYPDRTDCEECSEVDLDIGCKFSANILVDEIIARYGIRSLP